MTRLLISQDALKGKLPIAANLRRDEAMLEMYEAAKAFRNVPVQDTGSDSIHDELGPLNCWSFDDDPIADIDSLPFNVPNTIFYAPHDYPVAGDLIRTRKVARFVIHDTFGATFGYDSFGTFFDGVTQMPLDDIMILRLKTWVIDIPRAAAEALDNEDVLVAGHQMAEAFEDSGYSPDRFLRWLAPPTTIGENFIAMDVLNLVIFTQTDHRLRLENLPEHINPYQQSTPSGTFPYFPFPATPWASYWDGLSQFTAEYDEDRERFVAAHPKFPGHRTVFYLDHVRSGISTADADDQDENAAYTESFLEAIASDLAAYNVSYGGRVAFDSISSSHFTGLIESHFNL